MEIFNFKNEEIFDKNKFLAKNFQQQKHFWLSEISDPVNKSN